MAIDRTQARRDAAAREAAERNRIGERPTPPDRTLGNVASGIGAGKTVIDLGEKGKGWYDKLGTGTPKTDTPPAETPPAEAAPPEAPAAASEASAPATDTLEATPAADAAPAADVAEGAGAAADGAGAAADVGEVIP